MPNISNMQIGIGTNLGRLDSGLAQASKKITSFSKGVQKRLGSISTKRLEQGLSNIGTKGVPAAGQLASSMQGVQQPIRGTTSAVVNFNRVIQDAPFGIIGVANNIDPLIQSFNNLKSQTGSATGALTTMLKSAFTGPGALITVVSLASSAMLFFSMRMRGTKKEAEELTDTMSTLNKSWERTIELQEQFGAFDEDELGIEKMQAQIREITEDIEEQQALLSRINDVENQRASIIASNTDLYGKLTARGQQLLKDLDERVGNLGDEEQIQLRINELSEKRQDIAEKLANTADGLADSDTQQAQQAQKTAEQKERQLELERMIAEAKESVRAEPPDLEFLTDLPEIPDEDINVPDKYFPPGSLGTLKERLKGLQNELMIATNPQHIERLQLAIQNTKGEITDLKGSSKEDFSAMTGFANTFGNVLAQAALHGKDLQGTLSNIGKQLASKAFVTALGALLTGGASLGKKGFFGTLFSFHSGGTVPGAIGQERLALVQGGETIRTPKQERALGKGGGTTNVRITGTLKASGRDLRLVLDETNYEVGR